MLDAKDFREMWGALLADEDRQIQEATDRIRGEGADARNALLLLWRRFHAGESPPLEDTYATGDGAVKPENGDGDPGLHEGPGTSSRISLLAGIKRAIDSFDRPFTTADIIAFLSTNYPELRADERRVQISSAISKMVAVANAHVEIVRRGEQGMPHTYGRRVNTTVSANGTH